MKILICGNRNWHDTTKIYNRLKQLPKNTEIIHGACRGADQTAGTIAKQLGLKVTEYPALWHIYGNAAGPIRNRQMLNQKPDLVIAFHSDITHSKGTADTLNEAKHRNIKTELIE